MMFCFTIIRFYDAVVSFIEAAEQDSRVLSIKQTSTD